MASSANTRPLVEISKVVYYANVLDLRNWPKRLKHADTVRQNVVRLFSVLHDKQIDYLLIGGIALLQYIDARNSADIDLIISPASLHKLPDLEIIDWSYDAVRGNFGELQIDFLLTDNPLFKKVQQEYGTTQEFAEGSAICATVEGLLLLKMYSLPALYRQGQVIRASLYENDIATLIYMYRPATESLIAELAHHLSTSDLQVIANSLAEIQKRLDRIGAAK